MFTHLKYKARSVAIMAMSIRWKTCSVCLLFKFWKMFKDCVQREMSKPVILYIGLKDFVTIFVLTRASFILPHLQVKICQILNDASPEWMNHEALLMDFGI